MDASAAQRRTPTVIVARRVKPGREREVERWLRRLLAEAAEAPGYVDAEAQPPDALHPDEWVVVYQFEDADSLQAWLRSEERAALLHGGDELIVGRAREQVVALAPERDPVTAVSSVRVRDGAQEQYRALHDEIVASMRTFPGFLRCDLFEPVPGVQDDTVVVMAFDGREHLDRWLRSDERRAILARMDELVEGDRTVNVVGGFAGWFSPAGAPAVRTWKQAAVVLLALVPTSLVLTALREWLLPDVGLVAGVVLGNVAGVAILTWLLMPFLTRRLEGWLRR
jgi:antibiotic biosynthesis monooxygenase (ABM) superfamily enzyme